MYLVEFRVRLTKPEESGGSAKQSGSDLRKKDRYFTNTQLKNCYMTDTVDKSSAVEKNVINFANNK